MHRLKVSSFLRVGSETIDLIEQLFGPSSLRSYLAEFISTFIFVFAGVGSSISAGKLVIAHDPSAETGLADIALAHSFAFTAAVYMAANVSGGHVNPAVTFGFMIGGHTSILNGLWYCVAQMLGSTLACLLLMLVTSGQDMPIHSLAEGVTGFAGIVIEIIATFSVVYMVCAVKDSRNRSNDVVLGCMAIGFMVGANILAIGAFTGGSMNPARSFGPAIITGDFKNQWVYWLGPLIGGGLAGFLYQHIMPPTNGDASSSVTAAATV